MQPASIEASVSNPGGHTPGRLEAEVGRVPVPTHIGRIVRLDSLFGSLLPITAIVHTASIKVPIPMIPIRE